MKNCFLPLAFILSLSFGLFAQTAPFEHRCAYDHAVYQTEERFPGYKAQVDAVFEQARRMAANQSSNNRSLLTIPLAIHVVWKDSIHNLPECKIIEQVDILNENYQRLNADTANLRAIFSGVVGNPNIQFRLDTIIWRQSNVNFYSTGLFPDISISDKVKKDSTGGSTALNTTQYLNIWVCNLGTSGLLGYAYPPAGLSNWPANSNAPSLGEDGVVLDYRTVGRSGTYVAQSTTINTQGRAGVHEVGHFLGLRHVWGDGLLSLLGIPDCTSDDGVADTPNCGIPSNHQCNPNQNTCGSGTAGDLPDMIENFMDYSRESCQNSFTKDQIAIMRAVLGSERLGLTQTPALNPTVRPSNDALPHATNLAINTDASCTLFTPTLNTHASPSLSACSGAVANDVWYSFQAVSSGVIVDFSSIQPTIGSSSNMVHEVFSGNCGSLLSLGCSTANTDTIQGLVAGNVYFMRVYSADGNSAQSYNACVKSYGQVVSATNFSATLAEELKVYPNPSTGLVMVELPTSSSYQGSLEVRNFMGQLISQSFEVDQNSGQVELDLSMLPNGIYVLELRANGQKVVKKVVLQR